MEIFSSNTLVEPALLLVIFSLMVTSISYIIATRQLKRRYEGPGIKSIAVPYTLRLTHLPSGVNAKSLCQSLCEAESPKEVDGSTVRNLVRGYSLTQSLDRNDKLVSTVCLARVPEVLRSQATTGGVAQLYFNNVPHRIGVDEDFLGLTPLYWAKHWVVDIVAVTGWAGKPFKSWKPENAEQMWLRDWLGEDLKAASLPARIMTYGYSSMLAGSTCDATLRDYGQELLHALTIARQSSNKHVSRPRPIIFIGHSLGGLLLKQALKIASSSRADCELEVFKSCLALFMFGVPNHGLNVLALLEMTLKQKNETFARNLDIDSPYLRELEEDFSHVIRDRDIHIVNICEQLDTHSVQRTRTGWARDGPLVRMVSKSSAYACGRSYRQVSEWSWHTNHSNLVKFDRRDNRYYRQTQVEIQHIVQKNLLYRHRSQDNTRYIGIPQTQDWHFVGRENYLQTIRHSLSLLHETPVFILHGIGGVGKTQIALRFALTCSESFSKVVWIRADSKETIAQSLWEAMEKLDIKNNGYDMQDQVFIHLSQESAPILLIYDNLDEIALYRDITSTHKRHWKSPFRVLITTRGRALLSIPPNFPGTSVTLLDTRRAISLFESLLCNDILTHANRSQLGTLSEKLGYLPLAINQAALYMNVTGDSPETYISHLDNEPRSLLEFSVGWALHNKTIFNVWESTIKLVEGRNPYAASWFHMSSFLDRKVSYAMFDIAQGFIHQLSRTGESVCSLHSLEWLFSTTSGRWSIEIMKTKNSDLQRLSLITLDSSGCDKPTSNLHPLIQTWARLRQPLAQQKENLKMACLLIYACAEGLRFKANAPRDSVAAYTSQRMLHAHMVSCMEFSEKALNINLAELLPAECSLTFAIFLINEKKYPIATSMLEVILRHGEEVSGTTVSTTQRILSLSLRRQGELQKAELVLRTAIDEMRERGTVNDKEASELLRARGELATIFRDKRDYHEARKIQAEVFAEMKVLMGEESLETLHEMSCLATICKKFDGQLACAEKLESFVVDIYTRLYPTRPELLDKKRNLAITLYNQRRFDEAIEIERNVLRGKETLYGKEHIQVATAMQHLAKSCEESDRVTESIRLYSEALKIRQRFLGDSDSATRKTAKCLQEAKELLAASNSKGFARNSRVDSGIGDEE
ncbi:hypothetical protein F5Y16DRAFT_422059 [Xylariaceae sp. FL0255]|nr:hypothetical protein F5Y16DRAFT_422059 [Xylariaceae sp. FL0255]